MDLRPVAGDLSVQACNFLSKQRILRKFIAQGNQQFASSCFVLLPNISDCQQDARKRREIVAALSRQLQVSDSLLLVTGDAPNRTSQRMGAAMLPIMYWLTPVAR